MAFAPYLILARQATAGRAASKIGISDRNVRFRRNSGHRLGLRNIRFGHPTPSVRRLVVAERKLDPEDLKLATHLVEMLISFRHPLRRGN